MKGLLFFLVFTSNLLAAPWKLPWNSSSSSSQQQQQKWLWEQQHWNQANDPRVIERKMRKEHQKWEREQLKRQKAALKFLKSANTN